MSKNVKKLSINLHNQFITCDNLSMLDYKSDFFKVSELIITSEAKCYSKELLFNKNKKHEKAFLGIHKF